MLHDSAPWVSTVRTPKRTYRVNLKRSDAWERFVRWYAEAADPDGWATASRAELARLLSPGWGGSDSTRLNQLREWARAGYVAERGLWERGTAALPSTTLRVALTMKGVSACRAMGLAGLVTLPAAVPTPGDDQRGPSVALAPQAVATVTDRLLAATATQPANPAPTGTYALRSLHRALGDALALLDSPPTCDRQHTDDLSADELFDLAVAKAKAAAR